MFVSTFGAGMAVGDPRCLQDASVCHPCSAAQYCLERHGDPRILHRTHHGAPRAQPALDASAELPEMRQARWVAWCRRFSLGLPAP